MSNYFHEDVLWNIFIRLPAKQLAQMRCISKPFNHLLSYPSFVKSHLDHSVHKKDQVFLLFHSKQDFATHSSASTRLQFTNLIKLPVNITRRPHTATSYFVGSVHGLICYQNFSVEDIAILIWNPSLSALLTLPPSTIPRRFFNKVFLKFGFDPKNNDYKLVKLTFCNSIVTQVPLDVFNDTPKVEAYSMRKGCWESITERFPSQVTYIFEQDPTCEGALDGHLHWLVAIGHRRVKQKIVAFDLDDETFSEISLPHDLYMVYLKNIVLGVLDGKLCVMSWNVGGFECDVWVMNEYRVNESWTKYHVISFDCRVGAPIGFISKNEFLFEDYNGRLGLIDLDSAKVEFFKIEFHKRTTICKYVDSLVWVVPDKRGINIFTRVFQVAVGYLFHVADQVSVCIKQRQ